MSDRVQYCRKFTIEQGPAPERVQYGTKLSSMQRSASDMVQYWTKLSPVETVLIIPQGLVSGRVPCKNSVTLK